MTRARGEVSGHRQLHEFIRRNVSWLAGLHARTETVASTVAGARAVVELLAHVTEDGHEMAWPLAVVAESPDDSSVELPHLLQPVAGGWGAGRLRLAILRRRAGARRRRGRPLRGRGGGRGHRRDRAALFTPDGYFREPTRLPRDPPRLRLSCGRSTTGCSARAAASAWSRACLTDDGVRCAVEFNWRPVGRGTTCRHRPGSACYERSPDGRLAAVRAYRGRGAAGRAGLSRVRAREDLLHVDTAVAVLAAPLDLPVAEMGVDGLALGHHLVGVQGQPRQVSLAGGLLLGEPHQRGGRGRCPARPGAPRCSR